MARINGVTVVIPARNEEARLGACLESVRGAIAELREWSSDRIAVRTVVALDSCTDGSLDIVCQYPEFARVEMAVANVGAARAIAISRGRELLPTRATRTWIANTDADSTVPAHWLVDQVALADSGFDVVVGSVEPVREELSTTQLLAWEAGHPDGPSVGHIHGANLGVRVSTYLRAGGFSAVPEHEDVNLVDAMVAAGARITSTAAATVVTSGRSHGRTPSGYAGYLRDLESAWVAG
jgi:glycosyltransferase involved in cell wall biosynthesis